MRKDLMLSIKNRINTLFKTGLFHIFGGSVINKIIAFMSSIVLVRILTKEEYGVFTYSWNIYCIIALFCGMGYESGVLQMASERGAEKEYLKSVSNYGLCNGLIFNCILASIILMIGLFAPLTIHGSRNLIYAMCMLPFVQFIFNMCSVNLRVEKRNREFSILNVTSTLCMFAGSCLFAFLFREIGLVFGHYFSYIVACIIAFICYKISFFNKCSPLPDVDKQAVSKISVISMLNNGLSQLLYLLDVFVLGIVLPQETLLASYKVATMIPTALAFIPVSLITYVYPYFAEHKDDGKWCLNHYKQMVLWLGIFNLFISLCLFLLAPSIISLLFGKNYVDAVPAFRVLVCAYFVSGTFRTVSGNLLVTQRKLMFNLIVAVTTSIINIIADYFLVKTWGSIGAAFATLGVVLISGVINTVYLLRTFRNKVQSNETS